jgi:hypothetical protein
MQESTGRSDSEGDGKSRGKKSMNCQIIKDNEYHEKYLLERLSQQELTEYKQHLKECEACRKELENQLLVIGSLREIGKKQMKDEIRRQVEKQKIEADRFNWNMVLKIAAVILFFVITPGMIYYYSTFSPAVEKKSDTAREIAFGETSEDVKEPSLSEISSEKERVEAEKGRRDTPSEETQDIEQETVSQEITPKQEISVDDKDQLSAISKSKTEQSLDELTGIPASPAEGGPPTAASAEGRQGREKQVTPYAATAPLKQSEHEYERVESAKRLDKKVGLSRGIEEPSQYTYSYQSMIPTCAEKTLSSDKMEDMKRESLPPQTWLFQSDNRQIQVEVKLSEHPEEEAEANQLPGQFPVEVLRRDSLNLYMQWFVNQTLYSLNPQEIIIQSTNSDTLIMTAQNKYIYLIPLTEQVSQASQQKP